MPIRNNIERSYSELIAYNTFQDRYNYLKLIGIPCEVTFGAQRYVNQNLYKSREWLQIKNRIIIRDEACDLGVPGYQLSGSRNLLIHHMNPITMEMIEMGHRYVFDEEYLITVSYNTHQAIHYGKQDGNSFHDSFMPIERRPNDTIPWR